MIFIKFWLKNDVKRDMICDLNKVDIVDFFKCIIDYNIFYNLLKWFIDKIFCFSNLVKYVKNYYICNFK